MYDDAGREDNNPIDEEDAFVVEGQGYGDSDSKPTSSGHRVSSLGKKLHDITDKLKHEFSHDKSD